MMHNLIIKAFSACEAVEFFSIVNPFMFLGDDCPSQFRERPEWYFMDPIMGKPREVQVKVPGEEVSLTQDLGDVIRLDWAEPGMTRRLRGTGLCLDYPGASLALEYAIVGGVKIPADFDGCCNCNLADREKPVQGE